MTHLFSRSAIIIFCFLALYPQNYSFTRPLKGTIKGDKYIAPNDQFSFSVPPNAKIEERFKVISLSHFYQRTYYPVPLSVAIPDKTELFTVSFMNSHGLSTEITSMPIDNSSTPLPQALYRRTAQRFLQDIALPEWRTAVSRESWLGDDIECLKLDGMDTFFTALQIPNEGMKGITWNPEGARLHLHFGVLVFIKGNNVYMLVQSEANYKLARPEFIDTKRSLQEFYRSMTFNAGQSLAAVSNRLAR